MARFHPLTISELRRETDDAVSICFDVPDALTDAFKFAPGQYLTLRTTINGADIRRSYSICSGVNDNELRVAIKRVEDGVFSGFATEQLAEGDVLDVMPPEGGFTAPVDAEHAKHYLMIAAGSGITPILSLTKTFLAEEPDSAVTLVYGNRTAASILFLEELEGLKNLYPTRFSLVHILSRQPREIPLMNGRLDLEKCTALFSGPVDPSNADEVFLCGPEGMIKDAQAALGAAGVSEAVIHVELFTPADGGTAAAEARAKRVEALSPEEIARLRSVTIHYDGIETELKLATDGPAILDAAAERMPDLPYSCKGGMCCTCRCKVLEGQVEMDVNYALTPEEVADGFILSCQAHPVTDHVVLDFDEK